MSKAYFLRNKHTGWEGSVSETIFRDRMKNQSEVFEPVYMTGGGLVSPHEMQSTMLGGGSARQVESAPEAPDLPDFDDVLGELAFDDGFPGGGGYTARRRPSGGWWDVVGADGMVMNGKGMRQGEAEEMAARLTADDRREVSL